MWSALPRSWSISRRLTFLYTFTACLVLLVSGVFLDWVLRNDMEQEDRQFLAAEMQSIRILLREYPDDVQAWRKEIERGTYAAASTFVKYYVRIADEKQKPIVETPGMAQTAEPSLFPEPTRTMASSVQFTKAQSKDGKPLLLTASVVEGFRIGDRERVVHIALDMSHETAIIIDYRRKVAFVIIAGIFVSALSGLLITREGLRPLMELTRKVRRITPDKLQERVGPKGWPEEISLLAKTFDAMLDRLEDSFTSLSRFSADLAHELRTPINNLRGEAEVAISRARTVEDYRQVLTSSLEEYEKLSRMIENLLFLARSESRKTGTDKSSLNLRQEISEILEYYDAVREEKDIAVTVQGNALLDANKTLFRRAFANVISNSLQYTPERGRIAVLIDASSETVVAIRVSDTGIGIEAENISKIFDRFFRTGKARSLYPQGTGLGFSIVKSIMDLHGGTVSVISEPSAGTTVTLEFPRTRNGSPRDAKGTAM
jgi:two-component system heavy metal sensor histidine kinase CusS